MLTHKYMFYYCNYDMERTHIPHIMKVTILYTLYLIPYAIYYILYIYCLVLILQCLFCDIYCSDDKNSGSLPNC
jgi:hypothetical protein